MLIILYWDRSFPPENWGFPSRSTLFFDSFVINVSNRHLSSVRGVDTCPAGGGSASCLAQYGCAMQEEEETCAARLRIASQSKLKSN